MATDQTNAATGNCGHDAGCGAVDAPQPTTISAPPSRCFCSYPGAAVGGDATLFGLALAFGVLVGRRRR